MKGVWKPHRAKYTSGEEYWINNICVGSYRYYTRSKTDPVTYQVIIDLPSIKLATGEFQETQERARLRLERAVATWFRWLNEAPKGD